MPETMMTDTPVATKYAKPDTFRAAGLALALLGMLNAGYLTWTHLSRTRPGFCTAGGGCDIVQNSAYATIGSVPVALLGLIGFGVIFLGLLLERHVGELALVSVLAVAAVGTLYSAYLTYLEIFVLQAICPYCVVSAALMTGLLMVAVYRLREAWFEAPG